MTNNILVDCFHAECNNKFKPNHGSKYCPECSHGDRSRILKNAKHCFANAKNAVDVTIRGNDIIIPDYYGIKNCLSEDFNWHHLDPTTKKFGLMDRAKTPSTPCIMLCEEAKKTVVIFDWMHKIYNRRTGKKSKVELLELFKRRYGEFDIKRFIHEVLEPMEWK